MTDKIKEKLLKEIEELKEKVLLDWKGEDEFIDWISKKQERNLK